MHCEILRTFNSVLCELFEFLERDGSPPPVKTAIVVEVGGANRFDAKGRLVVRRDTLCNATDYEERFALLMTQGKPWVNINCCGVHDGTLIIVVESPPTTSQSQRTSINYSGPTRAVANNKWDLTNVLIFE
jgi:hypothetical protein